MALENEYQLRIVIEHNRQAWKKLRKHNIEALLEIDARSRSLLKWQPSKLLGRDYFQEKFMNQRHLKDTPYDKGVLYGHTFLKGLIVVVQSPSGAKYNLSDKDFIHLICFNVKGWEHSGYFKINNPNFRPNPPYAMIQYSSMGLCDQEECPYC